GTTCAATVAQGIRVGSWNTKPRPRELSGCTACACGHSTMPVVGALRPAMMRNAVDLPQPDGPSRETNSPVRTAKSRRSSATTPLAKDLPTPLSATTAGPDEDGDTAQASLLGGYFGRRSTPTSLFTNCSVYALPSATDGLTTPARTILS